MRISAAESRDYKMKMNFKKVICTALIAVMAAGTLSACGSSTVDELAKKQNTEATTEAKTEATTVAGKTDSDSDKDKADASDKKDSGKDTTEATEATTEKATTAADVIEDIKKQEEEDASEAEAKEKGQATEGVDVDLTTMSSTMVYSEVLNMMSYPDNYKGKIIRMNGTYQSVYDENTGNTYYYCVIKDATACCASGLEFVLGGGKYPQEESRITVQGKFTTYFEGEFEYITLQDAKRIS